MADLLNSPRSADVEKGIETVTEMSVQNLGSDGLLPSSGSITDVVPEATSRETTSRALPPITTLRTSTPVPATDEWTASASLAALECGLQIAETSASQLPELLPASNLRPMETPGLAIQTDDDNDSSLYEVPALPSSNPKVRFLTDLSESEKTVEETGSTSQFQLYGNIPHTSESGTEAGEESSAQIVESSRQGPSITTPRGAEDTLPELSGRARAILRTYFDEARVFKWPPGHSTVAFTEPQVYHLLRVLTDETLRMSYDTMEKMVLDAVGANPLQRPPGQRTSTREVGRPPLSGNFLAIPATWRRGHLEYRQSHS